MAAVRRGSQERGMPENSVNIEDDMPSKPFVEEEELPCWLSTEADKKLYTAAKLYDTPKLILADYGITKMYVERAMKMEKERERGNTVQVMLFLNVFNSYLSFTVSNNRHSVGQV